MWKAIIFNNIWKLNEFYENIFILLHCKGYFMLCYSKWCHRKEIKIIFIQNYYNNSVESFFFFSFYKVLKQKSMQKNYAFCWKKCIKQKEILATICSKFHSKEAFKMIYLKMFLTNSSWLFFKTSNFIIRKVR